MEAVVSEVQIRSSRTPSDACSLADLHVLDIGGGQDPQQQGENERERLIALSA